MYALPIVFFFILYEMPYGTILHWTVQNVLSTAQQLYINWLRAEEERHPGTGTRPARARRQVGEEPEYGQNTGLPAERTGHGLC